MLRALYIRDYALIEELEVGFDGGLNIITGETGAGKSILIGAMKMILGERASTEVVRAGAAKAVIEGIFDHVDSPRVEALLRENQLDVMETIILRREISSGQSRAFINDSPATVSLMREVARELIDLHGQHEHQSLLRPETHVRFLDEFGGLADDLESYRSKLSTLRRMLHERDRLVAREGELSKQKELFGFQIEEIDRIDPQDGEDDELEAERRILENAEHLFEQTTQLYEFLYESDAAVHDQLALVRNALQDLARIDSSFGDSLEEVRSVQIVISELAKHLQDYGARIEFNPERLAFIRERLGALDTLKRKYGGTVAAVMEYRREIGESFALASDFRGAIDRLSADIATIEVGLSESALALSAARKAVAARVERAVEEELARLGIGHSRFLVHFARQESPQGNVVDQSDGQVRRYVAMDHGVDEVEFYLTTNVGEEPRPLARIASGGEISRIMLALKAILAKNERLPILVFDEIDTGVSGHIARRVGETMRELARHHQIVAITHLPQIAALGDCHFLVEKGVSDGRTRTGIRRLEGHERTAQVAALLSGAEVTEASLASARQLIGNRTNGN